MRDSRLLQLTLVAVVVGVVVGVALRHCELPNEARQLVGFPGEIFMQVLKMMIVPLVVASLISALGQMNARDSSQMGLATIAYYLTTAVLASIIGVSLALLIHPGDPAAKSSIDDVGSPPSQLSSLDTIMDLFRNLFPENIVEATMKRSQTAFVVVRPNVVRNSSGVADGFRLRKVVNLTRGTNILGLIAFCTAFGVVVSQLGEKAKIVVNFFVILESVVMRFVSVVMWLAPIGIVSLIASSLLEIEDLSKMTATMTLYVLTVLLALILHCGIVVPTLFFVLTRKNPLSVAMGMAQPFVTAFGTASSGAALPQAISCAQKKIGIDSRVARFVFPLGSTINMDGTALYEAVAVIFIAQLNDVDLGIAEIVTIAVTSTFASIGLNAVPAGLVSIIVILNAVGLPSDDIALLFTVDWFLDRIRTALNTVGDAYAAKVVNFFLDEKLAESDAMLRYHAKTGTYEQLPQATEQQTKKVSFMTFDSSKTSNDALRQLENARGHAAEASAVYSLRNAIILPLRQHVTLQKRLSRLPEEP